MPQKEPENHTALAKLIKQLSAEGHQTFIFADTFHPSAEIRQALSSPTVMKSLAQSGVTKLGIEGKSDITAVAIDYKNADAAGKSKIIDKVAEDITYHRNNPDARKRYVKGFLDLFDQAAKEGITTATPDPRYQEPAENSERNHHSNDRNLVADLIGTLTDSHCSSIQEQAFRDSLSPEQKGVLARQSKKFVSEANAPHADTVIAGRMEALRSATEKQALVYGAMHIGGDNDLDELTHKPAVIAIADKPGHEILAQLFEMDKFTDMPDYVYYVQSQKVVALNSEGAVREFLFGDKNEEEFVLSSKQEKACLDSVKHLKPYYNPENKSPLEIKLNLPPVAPKSDPAPQR